MLSISKGIKISRIVKPMYTTYIWGKEITGLSHTHFNLYTFMANTIKTIAQATDKLISFNELLIDNNSQNRYVKKAKIISEYINPILIEVNIPCWFLYSFMKK